MHGYYRFREVGRARTHTDDEYKRCLHCGRRLFLISALNSPGKHGVLIEIKWRVAEHLREHHDELFFAEMLMDNITRLY